MQASNLPEDIISVIEHGISHGFDKKKLLLNSCGINDGMVQELCTWMDKLKGKVDFLDLSKNHFSAAGIIYLLEGMERVNFSPNTFYLADNALGDEVMDAIGKYVKKCEKIRYLGLGGNHITDAGIERLLPYLQGDRRLKYLSLSSNAGITNKSKTAFLQIIEQSRIEYIYLSETFVTSKNIFVAPFTANVLKNESDSLLFLGIGVNDENVAEISQLMINFGCNHLKELTLSNNEITSKGASILFDTLNKHNSSISVLDLSYNSVGNECMESLGLLLKENQSIESFSLCQNKVTNAGIKELSYEIIGNTTLKYFDISFNKGITNESSPYLLEIAAKTCIVDLVVDSTALSFDVKQEIEEALSVPIEERAIPIQSTTKSASKSTRVQ